MVSEPWMGLLDENIQNNPMQSSMVRPFERSRKNILTRRGWARIGSIFDNWMYDSAYDESRFQERCQPGAAQSASSADRRLCRAGQSGPRDRCFCWRARPRQAWFPACRTWCWGWTAAVRSLGYVEALSLRLHQPDQVFAPASTRSKPQSGTDLAVEELEARLSDDRQFPQGELGSPQGREPQFRAATS